MQTKFREVIRIPAGKIEMRGELTIPFDSKALVIFSHGSGSSRFSPRNNYVAGILQDQGISTFLLDLLTEEEDNVYENRFNIELLTERLILATKYIVSFPPSSQLKIGYFGASTGAASALRAAAALPATIHAIVSRGGRPDLAMDIAASIQAPTLLIIGGRDYEVIKLNQQVFDIMRCPKDIQIIAGATHLFEEPNTLHKAAKLATDWFSMYLQQEDATRNN
jgi:putative phosphoribosyl transferase